MDGISELFRPQLLLNLNQVERLWDSPVAGTSAGGVAAWGEIERR